MRTCALVCTLLVTAAARAESPFFPVEDVRPGLKGTGRTVMRGVHVETFQVELLGVMRNTNPGRDLVLARLSGLNLEHTGVIAGMSGSPVYVAGKLLGAVSYTWPHGKDPIAGITPITEMECFADELQRNPPRPATAMRTTDALGWIPLATPTVATGFTAHALNQFREQFPDAGMIPVQGGAAPGYVSARDMAAGLEPGGPMTVSMVTGDFDVSGVGTVTHIHGDKVYGWGHPFMGLGACELPLMTGYIHTVFPRQTVSFKMSSPLRPVGTVTADISTCIAGRLDRTPDMLPVSIRVEREGGKGRDYHVKVARQKTMMGQLVYSCLSNALDVQGELPDELTADIEATVHLAGREPLVIRDRYSGPAHGGGRAPALVYMTLSSVIGTLNHNAAGPIRAERVEVRTRLREGRSTAEVVDADLSAPSVRPGESAEVTAYLRPYRGQVEAVTLRLPVPAGTPEGEYKLTLEDAAALARRQSAARPEWSAAATRDAVVASLRHQHSGSRTALAASIPLPASGIRVAEQTLSDLPASVSRLMGECPAGVAAPLPRDASAVKPTPWVVTGSKTLTIVVSRKPS